MTIQSLLRARLVNLYIFLFCVTLLGIALYMEYVWFLEPCPLCVTQRVFFLACGIVSLIAFIHGPGLKGQKIYGFLAAALALAGASFAGKQIHLQGLPPNEVPLCSPSVGYMLEQFPFTEFLEIMFKGDGNCAEISWQDPILNMSIPQWSLVGFVMLASVCVFQALRK